MLKYNISEFNKNVFTELNNKWAIITAGNKEEGFNAMTVSWGGMGVLWNKNVCYIFIRYSRYTKEFADKTDSITLSFLSDEYKKEKTLFGRTSGRDVNKFEEAGLHATYDPDYEGYYVAESDYVLKCKKLYSQEITNEGLSKDILDKFYPTDDKHVMYVCEIKQYLVNEE